MDDPDLDDFLDLLTYTCPFTGRKRCAVSAGLECSQQPKRLPPVPEDAWLIHINLFVTILAAQ